MNHLQRLIIEMTNWRNDVGHRGLSSEAYHTEIQNFRKQAKALKLVREQFTITTILNALINDISVYDITLAYEYKGVKYTTGRHKVPGCKQTKVLHDNNMIANSDVWNSLPKYHIWVKTGKVLAPVL